MENKENRNPEKRLRKQQAKISQGQPDNDNSTKLVMGNLKEAKKYFYEGFEHGEKGCYIEAIESYTKSIEINPNNAEAYNNRGSAHANKGENDLAIKDFNKAIEINPNLSEALDNRVTCNSVIKPENSTFTAFKGCKNMTNCTAESNGSNIIRADGCNNVDGLKMKVKGNNKSNVTMAKNSSSLKNLELEEEKQMGKKNRKITGLDECTNVDGCKIITNNNSESDITAALHSSDLKNLEVIENPDDDFLLKDFEDISINQLKIDSNLRPILESRIDEIKLCMQVNASLSVIFLCGSSLEGILLNIANQHPKLFNLAKSAPKACKFCNWSLNNFINVAHEVGFIKEDVKKFSHTLRDFRNYIHPSEQMQRNFIPTEHTAKICFQVLKATIAQIAEKESCMQA